MATKTQKCPHCGAGWAGRTISSRHVSACAKKTSAARNPAGDLSLATGPTTTAVSASTGGTASVDSMWQQFKAKTKSAVSTAKARLKPASLGNKRKAIAVAGLALTSIGVLGACASSADVVSENLSTAAENFEIDRRVVFINGITDEYLLEIYGRCSVESAESALGPNSFEVTCKTGPNEYKKHYLGLSDNVTYMVEQVNPVDASENNYRVIWKPSVIIPDMEISTAATP